MLYYYTNDNGDPGSLANSSWSAVWAESFNGDTANPTWTITTVDNLIHTGAICIAANCTGTNRFAGDFINAIIDSTDVAHLSWMKRAGGTGAISIQYQKIQTRPASTYVPLPCLVPAVVSRKAHGASGTYDIPLPLTGEPGMECRTGGPSGNHQIVLTFPEVVTCNNARMSNSSGSVASCTEGGDGKQLYLNLTGVTNAQKIGVVVDFSYGGEIGEVGVEMVILEGDVNGSGLVDGNDVSAVQAKTRQSANSTNFRADVNTTGLIDGNDVSVVQGNTRTRLPNRRESY